MIVYRRDDEMKNDWSHMRQGCKCNCCMWHKSATIKIILAAIFVAMVVNLVLQLFIGQTAWLAESMLTFVGLVLMIFFIGWIVSMACSCKGRHWIHGPDEDPASVAKLRYARGEISKKEYLEIAKQVSK
jgi:uncharacterized membrane protein